jgi:signal transduction histidine kinase/integral membrane sensor domain MASE1/CheY-like chemotaxis protein
VSARDAAAKPPSTPIRTLALGAALVVAYAVAAKLGFRFAIVAEQITTVWAPTGIAIASLLLWGRRLWPAIWVGAFVANAGAAVPWWVAGAIATGNTLEAVVAVSVLRRLPRFDIGFQTLRQGVAFVIVAAVLSTTVSATLGVAALAAAAEQPWARFGELWIDWWLGDALGALVVAPAVLTLVRTPASWPRRRWIETAAFVFATAATTHLLFRQLSGPPIGGHPLEFIVFPFVIGAAVRLQQPATALTTLAASSVANWHTISGAPAMADADLHRTLLFLQTFMAMLAGTGLLLGAASAERKTGERRRAAAYAVGDALSAAASIDEAGTVVLERICHALEWPYGGLWMVDRDTDRLRCAATWTTASAFDEFARVSRSQRFASGVGLPGRVWATGREAWVEDVQLDTNFPRADDARAAGFRGGFAFPIRLGDQTIGVIECFNRTVLAPDADLLRTMSTVGTQIGQFVGRKQIETRVADLLERESIARREAESANRAKDEFLATLSHELRTPLNAIVGWTRMLLDGVLSDEDQKRALQTIDRNAHLQTRLVADILDVSRIITGRVHLTLRPVDLGTVIGAALDAVRPAAQAKQVRLISAIAGAPRVHEGDHERLQQVIWNLLTNAVKFTPPGGAVEIALMDGEAGGVRIRVRDDGAGIEPAVLPHVFERFWQADGSASRRHGGLGLGLAIVRHLVELHGGTVTAESEGPGRGATFTVDLPQTDAGRHLTLLESASIAALPSLTGCRTLIVDDEDDGRTLVATILAAAGASVQTASSADEALALLERAETDVLLADLGMPGADGFALIREVRSRDHLASRRLAVAAVTAYAGGEDRARALAAGFDRHVAKPISPAGIVETVHALWRGSTTSGSTTSPDRIA